LTRYTCVLLGPVFVLSVALGVITDRAKVTEKLKSKKFWIAPFVGLAIQLPWLIRQYSNSGDPLSGFRYAAGQLQRYAPEMSMPAHYYLAEMPAMLTIPILCLVLLGVAWVLKSSNKFGLQIVLVTLFLLSWFSAYRYKEFRLITAILPFLAALAGVGYSRVLGAHWSGFRKPWVALIVVLSLGFYSHYRLAPFFTHNRVVGYPSLQKSAQELSEFCTEESQIMVAPSPQFAWYSGRNVVGFPPREKFAEKLKEADFVVIVNYERGQPEYLRPLVGKLFPEPQNVSQKYIIVSDRFQNHTFITSGPELLKRLEHSLKKSHGD
jgi:hypothetical protein